MGHLKIQVGLIALLAFNAVSLPSRGADPKPGGLDERKTEQVQPARLPFSGKLSGVDQTLMTITLEGKQKKRVIGITSKTRITKAGKPATLEDALPGDVVGGQAVRTGEGKEEALSLRIGPKVENSAARKPKKKKVP